MGRERKITVVFYLNEALKPQIINEEEHFPVYVRIIFNRKSNQFFFPLMHGDGFVTRSEFKELFEDRKNEEINNQVLEYERYIKKIIRFEEQVNDGEFSLKGIAQKLDFYQEFMVIQLDKHLNRLLRSFLVDHLSDDQLSSIFHPTFFPPDSFQQAERLVPNLRAILPFHLVIRFTASVQYQAFLHTIRPADPVKVITWLDESHRVQFKNFLLGRIPEDDQVESKDPVWKSWKALWPKELENVTHYLYAMNQMVAEMSG